MVRTMSAVRSPSEVNLAQGCRGASVVPQELVSMTKAQHLELVMLVMRVMRVNCKRSFNPVP